MCKGFRHAGSYLPKVAIFGHNPNRDRDAVLGDTLGYDSVVMIRGDGVLFVSKSSGNELFVWGVARRKVSRPVFDLN